MFVIILKNKKTGFKTLMSTANGTRVFDSREEALTVAEETYGKDNPEVSIKCALLFCEFVG